MSINSLFSAGRSNYCVHYEVLMKTLRDKGIDFKDFLKKVRKLREKTNRMKLAERFVNQAKNEGRA